MNNYKEEVPNEVYLESFVFTQDKQKSKGGN